MAVVAGWQGKLLVVIVSVATTMVIGAVTTIYIVVAEAVIVIAETIGLAVEPVVGSDNDNYGSVMTAVLS